MNIRYINIFLLLTIIVCACTHEEFPKEPIAMKASINNIDVQVKSAGTPMSADAKAYVGTTPSAERPLDVDLCFSLNSGDYSSAESNDKNTYLPCRTTASFKDENITQIYYKGENDKTLAYPTTGKDVYCIGLYPQSKWNYSNGMFKADLTGSDDLMFASQISGKWNQQFGTNNNSLQFRHLLTWFKLVLCATSYDAIDAWGHITSITLDTAKEIQLSPVDNSVDNSVTFSTDQQTFELVKTPIELSILKNEVGSMFIAPTTDPITLTIKADDGRIAKVDMKASGGFNPGSQYIMVLYFDSLSVVDALCTLESWENQNDNLYLE